jgi:hypothetical protein
MVVDADSDVSWEKHDFFFLILEEISSVPYHENKVKQMLLV